MSRAMTHIVDAYVKLNNRRALEQLLIHRRALLDALQLLRGPYDAATSIKQNQDELAIIEAGIARLG